MAKRNSPDQPLTMRKDGTPWKKYAHFTGPRLETFYEVLRATGRIQYSAFQAGVHPKTEARFRKENEEHAEAVEECLEVHRNSIEAEVRRRAIEGVDKPLSFNGRLTGDTVKDYSDNLLLAHAKRHIPEYREKHVAGEGGAAPMDPAPALNVEKLTKQQRAALRLLLGTPAADDVEDAVVVDHAPS